MNKLENALNDLIKGGAGSRGGNVIGKTKSGKPVYGGNVRHPSHMNFSEADHRDAARLNSEVGKDAHRDHLSSPYEGNHKKRSEAHNQASSGHASCAVRMKRGEPAYRK